MDRSSDLWERDRALSATARVLECARDGSGGSLFIAGEAGLGKTVVLERACGRARDGMRVVTATGDVMEASLPFGIALQLVEAGVVDPEGSASSAPHYRVLQWLEDLDEPMLIAVDDLHWADSGSLALLGFLCRRVASLPVAMIATLRPWPPQADELSRTLRQSRHAAVERLAPLSETSSGGLLADRVGAAVSGEVVDRAWRLCQGNPLLVEQVAMTLARGEDVPEPGADAPLQERELLLARFAGLDAAGLRCAQAASVLGAAFLPEVATEVAQLEDRGVDEVLDALFRTGLLVHDPDDRARFAHPLFAQSLYEDLGLAVRRRLHARAFAALDRRGLTAEAAEHALRGELRGDPAAIAALTAAGRRALAGGAFATAAHHLEGAVHLAGDHPSAELMLGLGEALVRSGRAERAAAALERLVSGFELAWPRRVQALRMLGRARFLMGAPDLGGAPLREAAALAGEHDPAAAVAPLLDQTLSAWLAEGPVPALPLAQEARALARGADESVRLRADSTWGFLALAAGDGAGLAATEGVGRMVRAGGAIEPDDLSWPFATLSNYGFACTYVERLDEAEHAWALALDGGERAGAVEGLSSVFITMAWLAIRRGRLLEALELTERAVEAAEFTPGTLPYASLARAEARLWVGHVDECDAACDEVERAAGGRWFVDLWLWHVRGLRLLWRGDPGAREPFLALEELTLRVGLGEPCMTQWAGHAIAAHLTAGHPDDAARVIEWLEGCAERLPCRWPQIAATVGRARLAESAGDVEAAEAAFTSALALHADLDLPLQHVETLLAWGGFLRRRGQTVRARPPLAEALAMAESCAAAPLASIARGELAVAGGRRRRSREDRDELTPSEERVAQLAAAGHSNKEIAQSLYVSVNTVETHLKRIYAKLGIRSRRELMTARRDA